MSTVLQSTWIYDIANDLWFRGADMPGPRFGSAVGLLNGKIVVAGGGSDVIQTTTWQYDPLTDSFTNLAPMPDGLPTYRIHGVGLDQQGSAGQLHALAGGFNGTGHYVYDAATDTWSLGLEMPSGVTDPGVATDGIRIFVSGGPDGLPGLLQTFHLDSGTWSQGPVMPQPVNNTSAAIGSGILFCMGGYNGVVSIPDNQGTSVR